jgi:gluconolactonase
MRETHATPLLCLVASALLTFGCQSAADSGSGAPATELRSVIAAEIGFTEGPTEYKDGSIFFTEMRTSRIMRYYPEDGRYESFNADSHGANGLIFDSEWRLIACEGEPPQVTRTNLETGEVEILADSFEGKRLNQPNDVTFDSQGRLYFSDRPTPNPALDQTGVNAVYRIDTDGSLHQILTEPEIDKPNGIAISPNDSTLYLIEAHPDANKARMIRAYDLNADGTVTNRRVFHDFYPGRSGDGMTIDASGNLWVAAGLNRTRGTSETLATKAGVYVFAPTGEQLDFYPINEDTVTNVAFAGEDLKTLYLTSGDKLYRFDTEQVGTRR